MMPSVAEYRSNKSGQPAGRKYYNRPKFLQAPDPSSLATPLFGVADGKSSQFLSLIDQCGVPLVSTKPIVHHPVWLEDETYGTARQYTPSSRLTIGSQLHSSPSVAPFLPQGLQQMNPLSPKTRVVPFQGSAHSNSPMTRAILTTSCARTHPRSPITRPMKRARTSSTGQGRCAQDFINDLRCENECKRKRPRLETHESVFLAQCYTDYLITAITKAHVGEVTPSPCVYDKLWRNVMRLLWDFGLSESVILLAFWYIDRLFPDGFMHPEIFTRSEGGVIAWRILLLGVMLAEKWLEDGPHGLKTWQSYFELPSNSVRVLEQAFLEFLDYNISISNSEWQNWIGKLKDRSQAKFRAGHSQELQSLFMDILCEIADDAMIFSTGIDRLRLLYKPESESCQVVFSLLQPYSSDETLEFTSFPLLLRKRLYSTSWNPAADPVVTARPRCSGIAPIARPMIHSVPRLSSFSVPLHYHTCSLPETYPEQFGGIFYASIVT